MLHAAFVRSPVAHALITSVDVSEARALPGVVAVYTGAEIQALLAPGAPPLTLFPGLPASPFTILATDKVRLVGDPIALVIAETKYVAEDGAELVEIDYDDLRPVASSADALDPTSTPIFEDAGSNVLVNGRTVELRRSRRGVREGRPRRVRHDRPAPPPERTHGVPRQHLQLRSRHRDADGPWIEPGCRTSRR